MNHCSAASKRTCSKCGALKRAHKFYTITTRERKSDGVSVVYRRRECKQCCLTRAKKKNASNKAKSSKRDYDIARRGLPQYREAYNKTAARYRDELSDWYIKRLLTSSCGLKPSEIPQQLIDLKRMHVKILRQLKESPNEQH